MTPRTDAISSLPLADSQLAFRFERLSRQLETENAELQKKLADERTISDILAGAISGTFDYSEAIERYNASLELPRNGIPPVNIFTRRDGAP